jgi:cytosine/uracil/thiamine/allantoin permease
MIPIFETKDNIFTGISGLIGIIAGLAADYWLYRKWHMDIAGMTSSHGRIFMFVFLVVGGITALICHMIRWYFQARKGDIKD